MRLGEKPASELTSRERTERKYGKVDGDIDTEVETTGAVAVTRQIDLDNETETAIA